MKLTSAASSDKLRASLMLLEGIHIGNVRTDQIKRTAKELIRLHPDKFTTNFEENKKTVSLIMTGLSSKIRNQIAGYVTRLLRLSTEEEQTETEEEPSEEGETE